MKVVILVFIFSFSVFGTANAEPRFEMLSLDVNGFGDLTSIANEAISPSDPELSAVREEIEGFYLAGDLEFANKYQSGVIRAVAANTGILDVLLADSTRHPCTATLLTDRLILTNNHCVPSDGSKRAVKSTFTLGYETGDLNTLGAILGSNVILPAREQSKKLDYAVLELAEAVPGFVPLRITALRDPSPSEPLVIMGFPGLQPLSVARKNCLTTEQFVQARTIFHLCRTFGGNSGSLMFADDWSLVGLHNAGHYDNATGKKTELSSGIQITEIISASRLLREVLLAMVPANVSALPSNSPVTPFPPDNEGKLSYETQIVQDVQSALIRKNCLDGNADGVLDHRTRDAIRLFNQTNQTAIKADKLREAHVSAILSQMSQNCDLASASNAQNKCFEFNGSEVCE